MALVISRYNKWPRNPRAGGRFDHGGMARGVFSYCYGTVQHRNNSRGSLAVADYQ